jgi:hypothetical protein
VSFSLSVEVSGNSITNTRDDVERAFDQCRV